MAPRRSRRAFAVTAAAFAAVAVVQLLLSIAAVGTFGPPAVGIVSSGTSAAVGPSQSPLESPLPRGTAAHPLGGPVNSVVDTVYVPGGPTSDSIAFDATNGYLYFGSNGTNLTAIDGSTNTIKVQLPIGPYASPATPNYVGGAVNDIYAPVISTDPPPDNVTVVSGTSNLIVKYLSTGGLSYPTTGVYDPTNGYLYIPAMGATLKSHVTVINTATNTVETTIPVGAFPSTPAYDPADGDLYVPNTYSSNNLTIISDATDKTIGSIPITFPSSGTIAQEDFLTESPVYDPITRAVYQPDTGGSNLTEITGTSVVKNFTVGPGPQTPAVDPVTGNLFVPIAFDSLGGSGYNVSIVNVTSNTVTTIYTCENPETPVYDPANNLMYVSCQQDNSNYGAVTAMNATTGAIVATINVGVVPLVPAFDGTNDELYVPNFVSNNVTVIGAGPFTSPPGTYPVTFTQSGLPAGAWWTISLSATTVNETSDSIVFDGIPDGSYSYTLGAYQDETSCVPKNLNFSQMGTVTVAGAPVTVTVDFSCIGSGGGSGGSLLFLGLPGDEGYYLLIGVSAVVIVGVSAVLLVKRRPPRRTTPGAPSSGGPPPPGAWTPPPPPPPSPPP